MALQPIKFAIRRLESALETGRILRYLVGSVAFMAVASAVIIRIFDHQDFPSLGLALWWAVSTVTTVGYGDVYPESDAGRVIAMAIMLVGIGFVALLTAFIADRFIQEQEEVEAKIEAKEDVILTELREIATRLDRLERGAAGTPGQTG